MLLCSVIDPILVAIVVWIGEHWGFSVGAYFEDNKSVIAKTFRRRFINCRKTLFLMQILLDFELSICNKLVVCLEQENLNDADISNTNENVQLVRSVAERLSIRSARNHGVRFGCRLLFEVDFTIYN